MWKIRKNIGKVIYTSTCKVKKKKKIWVDNIVLNNNKKYINTISSTSLDHKYNNCQQIQFSLMSFKYHLFSTSNKPFNVRDFATKSATTTTAFNDNNKNNNHNNINNNHNNNNENNNNNRNNTKRKRNMGNKEKRTSYELQWTEEEHQFFKLSKQKKYEMLNQKFEEFKASNMVTVTIFNIMINSIKKMKQSKASDLNTLDNLLQEMEALNITKNTDTYNNTINLLGQYKEINRIEKYLIEMDENNIRRNRITYNILINVYGRSKKFNKVKSLYNEMIHNNDEFDNGEEKEMVAVEQNEEEKQYYNNIQPDSHTYNTLINVFGKHLKMNDVDYFVNEMQNNGIKLNFYTYNTLISMYGKNKDFYTVSKVFKRMKRVGIKPGINTYMALVVAYTRAEMYDDCEEYVKQLENLISKKKIKNWYVNSALEKYYSGKALYLEKQNGGRGEKEEEKEEREM